MCDVWRDCLYKSVCLWLEEYRNGDDLGLLENTTLCFLDEFPT